MIIDILSLCLLSLYFTFLLCFCFVTHPLCYCFLLVVGALCLSLVTFFFYGFSWYLVLFVLVYVGGIYVLFLFVSVHSANSYSLLGLSWVYLSSFYLLFLGLFYFFFDFGPFVFECSRYLCSGVEGLSYLVLCLCLLIGFVGVSLVSCQKESFFR